MNIRGAHIIIELPFIGNVLFWAVLLAADQVEFEAQEHYVKGSFRNRCYIGASSGPLRISIPLAKGKHQQQPIDLVQISYDEPWQKQAWHSIKTAYGSAPYFWHYMEELRPLFEEEFNSLFEYNKRWFNKISTLLSVDLEISYTNQYLKAYPTEVMDLRNAIRPSKINLPKSQFNLHPYSQLFMEKTGFLANLSILDLVFCTGPQAPLILESYITDEPTS